MNKEVGNNTAPMKPYEDKLEFHGSIYDNMPYERDKEICNESNIVIVSGNVIKAHRCTLKEPYEIKH